MLYYTQGKYAQAESLFYKALAIWEKITGPKDHHIANTLNSLAELYRSQGKYVEAEPLYERALAIRKQILGAEHRDVSNSLNRGQYLATLIPTSAGYRLAIRGAILTDLRRMLDEVRDVVEMTSHPSLSEQV